MLNYFLHLWHADDSNVTLQAAPGVEPIKEGMNPATWMLEQSTVGQEARLGVNFADIYRQSSFAR